MGDRKGARLGDPSQSQQQPGGALLRAYHLKKSYGQGGFAIADLGFEVGAGELVFVTGPSGAGKTTLLRLIFGAERPSSGQAIVLGRNVGRLGEAAIRVLRRRIGFVFQDFKLLPRRSVEENVAMPLEVVGTPRQETRRRVFAILKRLGLEKRRQRSPLSLSGGEQQRVAIARALVGEPAILLADEPTGNLDAEYTLEIMDWLADVAAHGTAVLVATHDANLVERSGARVLELAKGRLVADTKAGER